MSASTMIVRMTKPSRRYAVTMCLENFLPSILGARRPRFSNDAHFETAGIDVDDDIAGMFGIVASGAGEGDEAFACIAAMFVCGIGEAGLAAIAGAAAIGAATIGGSSTRARSKRRRTARSTTKTRVAGPTTIARALPPQTRLAWTSRSRRRASPMAHRPR